MRHTIILIALLCAACSSALPSLKPYRMDIQQGNIVTSKMLLQLRPGMTQSQVKFIMGTPLIQDSFHKNRWDYFYQYRKDGKVIAQRRVILEFENDSLKRVRGDTIPPGPDPTVPEQQVIPKEPEKGLMDRLKVWKKDEEPAAAQKPQESLSPGSDQIDPNLVNPPASAPVPAAPATVPAESTSPSVEAPVAQPKPVQPKAAPAQVQQESSRPAEKPPAAAPSPSAQTKSSAQPSPSSSSGAKSEAKPAADEDDLPPEEDPSYFERMLEKIGF